MFERGFRNGVGSAGSGFRGWRQASSPSNGLLDCRLWCAGTPFSVVVGWSPCWHCRPLGSATVMSAACRESRRPWRLPHVPAMASSRGAPRTPSHYTKPCRELLGTDACVCVGGWQDRREVVTPFPSMVASTRTESELDSDAPAATGDARSVAGHYHPPGRLRKRRAIPWQSPHCKLPWRWAKRGQRCFPAHSWGVEGEGCSCAPTTGGIGCPIAGHRNFPRYSGCTRRRERATCMTVSAAQRRVYHARREGIP